MVAYSTDMHITHCLVLAENALETLFNRSTPSATAHHSKAKMHFLACNNQGSGDWSCAPCQILHDVRFLFCSVTVPGLLVTLEWYMQFTQANAPSWGGALALAEI